MISRVLPIRSKTTVIGKTSLDEVKGLLAKGAAEECKRVRDLLERIMSTVLRRHLTACQTELKKRRESVCCPVLPMKERPGTDGG
jgi:hypothetical protein